MLDTRQHPQLGVEPLRESCLETLNDFASRMEKATEEACSALARAANDMARFYGAHRREAPLYEVRDRVWLNGHNITTTQPTKKLDHKWLQSIPNQKGHFTEHILAQTTFVVQPNPPSFFGHTIKTL